MILKLSSKQLRQLADQVDALTAMYRAGAPLVSAYTPIVVDGYALAYVAWFDSQEKGEKGDQELAGQMGPQGSYLAEFISFVPGDAPPLSYHDESDQVAPAGTSPLPRKAEK